MDEQQERVRKPAGLVLDARDVASYRAAVVAHGLVLVQVCLSWNLRLHSQAPAVLLEVASRRAVERIVHRVDGILRRLLQLLEQRCRVELDERCHRAAALRLQACVADSALADGRYALRQVHVGEA